MARALLVGCGCRGRELGARLLAAGWRVRGTSRTDAGLAAIEAAGIEPALADPDRIATLVDHFADVAVVAWLLGSADGDEAAVAALHGPRLERLCEELVDTPVRGLLYEAVGAAPSAALAAGRAAVAAAAERWRIRVELVEHEPADAEGWADAARGACDRLVGV